MKKTSILPAALSCAALLASAGFASATDYVAESVNVGNGSAVTIVHPVEREATVAVFAGGPALSPQHRSAPIRDAAVQHAPSGNGSAVTFLAPNP